MLERDGLVETAPYRGARVTRLTAKEVEETYFIRSHLESIATGLAAERITDSELAQLDVLMTRMRAAVDAQDGPTFSDINREFHRTIVASCGNDMLRELTMDIWQRHSGFQRVFRMVPGRIATSQTEHEGIMVALRDHDAERAARLALLHKRSVGDAVSALVDQVDERGSDVGHETVPTARLRTRAAS
jgi:DNA-binding GntR family transcriptional regulator